MTSKKLLNGHHYSYKINRRVEQGTITNLMAWYAAEEICRMFDE